MKMTQAPMRPIQSVWKVFLLGVLLLWSSACERAEQVQRPFDPTSATTVRIAFTDVTEASGLGAFRHETGAFGQKWFPESMGSGCGFIDYNNDGWLDIVLVGGGVWPGHSDKDWVRPLWLYRNNGDGTFTDVTDEAGLGKLSAYALGVTAADYDNDGYEDLYVTTLWKNILLRNNGDGTFTDVTAKAGVAGDSLWSSSAIFFDADGDGDLDLFVGNYVYWTPETDLWCSLDEKTKGYCTPEAYTGIPPYFFRNNGDGTFTDESRKAGFVPAPGKTLGVAETDYNHDGCPDLYVANDTQPDQLYRNNCDGTFTDIGLISGVAYDENGKARAGMGNDAGVVDTTGQVSLFVGNFSKEMIGVYRYIGNDLFIDRAAVSKIGRASLQTLTFGLFLFDVDRDGDLDLFAANGHVQDEIERVQDGITYAQPPHLFLNDGYGFFEDVAPKVGGVLAQPIVARGACYGDFNRDGLVDILVTENSGRAHLWRNDTQGAGHYLRVQLVGTQSHPQGISSQVVVRIGPRRLEQRVRTGGSYLAVSEKTLTFGLGAARRVDAVEVRWASGLQETFGPFDADQEVRLIEGTGRPTETLALR
jgi:enediyne biosynthesis protein E4